jgi:two-component system, OmpR family, response regulator
MRALQVLIIDDEEELVSALVERLNLRGFQARGVTAGGEALSLLQDQEFDVVLLDMKMPGLDGLEVIRRIKELRPSLEVILLTGHGSANAIEEGMALGAFDYLMKPVKIDDLVRILAAAGAGMTPDAGKDQGGMHE